jgi:histidinol dehydrogenase
MSRRPARSRNRLAAVVLDEKTMTLGEAEGLAAHARSVALRLKAGGAR